jgi:hypothetical protein
MSRVRLSYDHRPRTALGGRFGGGWQWKLGGQAAIGRRSGTVIINLLVASIRIDWKAP